ncbi:GPP34 family phosphoprotein [Amycolatopsis pigmentata]|uniref:GPP34 family phosphoprotein n=1 Tax=Amycolatopsis pigmentata TaxID=450801 RepID=A0ABW5FT92_9PSEU
MTRDPESLPEKLFLLAVDARQERLRGGLELGYALRAAALADLLLRGHLRDESGKACVAKPASGLDPLLQGVWEEVERAGRCSWRRLINRGRGQAIRATRDALAGAGVIRVGKRRVLGLFPATKITLRGSVHRLADEVGRAIRGGGPVARIDPDVAALAVLASAIPLRTVISVGERRRFKKRRAALGEPIEPIPDALRRVIANARAVASG